MIKKIYYILIIYIIFGLSIVSANTIGANQESNNQVSSAKGIVTEIKKEGSYYSESTKEKYNTSLAKFKYWYKKNNKSIMYLPYLDVKIFDFFSGIFISVFIIWLSVKFLTKKR